MRKSFMDGWKPLYFLKMKIPGRDEESNEISNIEMLNEIAFCLSCLRVYRKYIRVNSLSEVPENNYPVMIYASGHRENDVLWEEIRNYAPKHPKRRILVDGLPNESKLRELVGEFPNISFGFSEAIKILKGAA